MFASAAMYLSTRAIVRNPRWDRRNPQGIIALAREMERCLGAPPPAIWEGEPRSEVPFQFFAKGSTT
jgi:hypothetical protein